MIRRMIKLCSRLGAKHIPQLKKVSISMPEESQSSPEEPQSSPEESQSLPEESQSSPEESQSSPEDSQSSPEGSQSSPEEPRPSPEEPRPSSEEPQSSLQPPRAPKPEFLTETRFDEFNLPAEVLAGLKDAGFVHCTPIQAQTLPVLLTGRDVAGQAQTGTGKTAAFLVTVLNRLLSEPAKSDGLPQALIVAPTRELSQQIYEEAKVLCRHTQLTLVQVVGGVDYVKQADILRGGVDIVICTPGRIIDYYKQKIFKTEGIKVLVIDEADRLLDLGFAQDMRYILRKLPAYDKRQSMLFSATLSYRVMELTYEYMNLPEFISVTPQIVTVEGIEQSLFHVGVDKKIPLILGLLKREEWNRMLIFVNTKSGVEYLTYKLKGNGWPAEGITGDLPQRKRFRLMAQYKKGELKILVATDVASRGIHVEDISHVINYDLPQDSENYIHRIGRTARAGKTGTAISLACEKYVFHLEPLEKMLDYKIPVVWPEDDWYVEDHSKPFPVKRKTRLKSSSQRRTRSVENKKRVVSKPPEKRKPSSFPGAFFGFGPQPVETEPESQETKPQPAETEPEPQGTKPEPQGIKPEPQETKPRSQETKPRSQETKPRSQETKPRSQETKPRSQETKLKSQETKPRSQETKPRSQETKPRSQKTKPKSQETKPRSQETKPKSQETKPKSQETKPVSQETKAESAEQKPKTAEKKRRGPRRRKRPAAKAPAPQATPPKPSDVENPLD
jgi:ATP-dependent RNA helicase RhlB